MFDGKWTMGGSQFTAVLTITIQGNRVTVLRRNASLGSDCEMSSTLAANGVTVTGTTICTQGRGDFRATIECR